MKCGTTSLHKILASHNSIFIPDGEMKFFSLDDIIQQKQFFPYNSKKWYFHSFSSDFSTYKRWYESFFIEAKSFHIIGEDAPSYLYSEKAAIRIKEFNPNARFIIILRDPVKRAWSNYWHNVSNFSAFFPFEETIRYAPEQILNRSFYQRHVSRYLELFPRKNFHFILFEDFISNQETVVEDVLKFLGISSFSFDSVHSNKTQYPSSLKLRLLRNRVFKYKNGQHFFSFLPNMPEKNKPKLTERIGLKIEKILNPPTSKKPEMKSETKEFLTKVFQMENDKLSELIGVDTSKYWYK
jgi:hypothetical protein